MSSHPLADRLGAAADLLTTVDRSVPGLAVPAATFGAEGAGLPGRVGRELYAHWEAVLAARGREAALVAGRLHEMSSSVRDTAQRYAETDDAAARRFEAL